MTAEAPRAETRVQPQQPPSPPKAAQPNERSPAAKTHQTKPPAKPTHAPRSGVRGMGEHVPAFMTRSVRPLD